MIFGGTKNSLQSKKSKSNKKSKGDINDFDPNPMLEANDLKTNELIGKGYFSYVYSGFKHKTIPVAIKIIRRGNDKMEENELELLKALKGKKHIIQLYDGFIKDDNAIFVFEKINSIPEKELLSRKLSIENIRFYLKCILEALKESHRINIIHRDLRFQNILVSKNFGNVTVIDWGCGTKISSTMRSSVGARSTRSPEMLMGYNNFGTKGDTWSIGALIVYILSEGNIPWNEKDSKETLIAMSNYFGAQNLIDLENILHLNFHVRKLKRLVKKPIIPLESAFSPKYDDLDKKDLMDLVHKCFILDYRLRPSASDLLDHDFFKS